MRARVTRRRPTPAFFIAMIALVLSLGGTSYAASTVIRKNSVGSKQIKRNAVTSSKVKNGSLLAKDFKAGELPSASGSGSAGAAGATGPAGPKGDTGAKGDPGAKGDKGTKGDAGTPAVSLWSVVTSAGAVSRGRGTASSQKLAGFTGQYEVVFNRDVSQCAYDVSVGGEGGSTPAGLAGAARRSGNVKAVFVHTRNPAGTDTDLPFHLQVAC